MSTALPPPGIPYPCVTGYEVPHDCSAVSPDVACEQTGSIVTEAECLFQP